MTSTKSLVFLAASLGVACACSAARAGDDPPFQVEAFAQANISIPDDPLPRSVFDRTTAPDTSSAADAEAFLNDPPFSDFSAIALARFVEFRAASTNNTIPGSVAQSVAGAADTLTIEVAGAPTGATSLEMTWRVEGELSGTGNQQASFNSSYRTDTAGNGQPDISLPPINFNTNGSISGLATFTYDNVPLGSPWNLLTQLSTSVTNPPGEADFFSTVTFVGATLLVDGMPTTARITGQSGQVYAVPEPASLALLGLAGLALAARRRFGGDQN